MRFFDQAGSPATPTQEQSQAVTDSEAPDADRWKALGVCLVAGFMTLLDVSIVNVALPSIRTGLSASSSTLQWITAGYALAFGLTLVPAGRLGDARSRRLVFAVGLVVFTAASGFAGAATSSLWLVVARIVQGLGAGLVSPQVAGFIQVLFRGGERAKAFGLFGATVGISTAIGPVVGGALILGAGVDNGWRWVFYVNLPIGVLALVLARRYLPRGSRSTGRRQSLDPVGVGLFAGAMFALLWPLVEGSQASLADRQWWLEAVAASALAAFVLWERRLGKRGGQPMVDLSLFRLRSYALGTSLAAVYFAGFTPLFLVLTLYLQVGLGYDALLAGVTSLPFAIGAAVAAGFGGRFVTRFGRSQVVLGLVFVAVGMAALYEVVGRVHHGVGLAFAGPLLVAGLGSGTVIAPNQTLTLSEVPRAGGGSGAGVVQTAQRAGAAVGIAVVTAVFFSDVAQTAGSHASGGSAAGRPGGFGVYSHAMRVGVATDLAFVCVAFVIGLLDVVPAQRLLGFVRRLRGAGGS